MYQRRFSIDILLPAIFCAIPAVAAALIFFAVPPEARQDYLTRLEDSPIDWIILSVGTLLFLCQSLFAFRALRWDEKINNFNEKPEKWLSHLGLAAEWFPLLGLIGTVAAILQTFGSFGPGSRPTAEEIIQKYGPAITATGSGLFMALLNILPGWMVNTGRMLIQQLSGEVSVVDLKQVESLPPSASITNSYPMRGRS